ncbi:MFS transporter [Thermoactinomyces sp. DSM 45892]|uniref:MFS transporter n=1 Tax=Thermoactinomyces sp. DSM 45892 TaxID=1882753 RepID=UPI00089BF985|nr:MFS transporter [Thermoactinomyces sp. DSM 45892]SDY11012.1 Major Facilitator Superfamily protein [Thermoactinomyces sp. DSM 45892]
MKWIIHNSQYLLLKKNKKFLTVWLGTLFTTLADRVFLIILPIWLYEISKSGKVVALGTTAETVATLSFGFLGGVLIDRSKKKNMLVLFNFLASFLLIVLLIAEKITHSWLVILIGVFLVTAFNKLSAILREVVIISLVDKEDFIVANSMVGFILSTSLVLGSLIAGISMVLFSYNVILIYCASSYFIYGCFSIFLRIEEVKMESHIKRSFGIEMIESLQIVKKNRYLWGNLAFMIFHLMGIVMFSSLTYLFIKTILGKPVEFYTWYISLQGIGSIFGSMLVSVVRKYFQANVAMGWIFLLIFSLHLTYLLVESPMLMLLSSLIVGILQQIGIVTANTVFQKHCPKDYLGRIIGLRQTIISIFTTSATGVGAFFLDYVTVDKILYCACGLFLVCGICGYFFISDSDSSPKRGLLKL